MSARRTGLQNIVFLVLAVALSVAPFIIKSGAEFTGADNLAQQAIHQLRPDYTPWIKSLWEPPSSEIATLLFTLQAAIGAGFIGYYLGSRRNRQKKPDNDRS
jgi:cobalt/nickel transport protein